MYGLYWLTFWWSLPLDELRSVGKIACSGFLETCSTLGLLSEDGDGCRMLNDTLCSSFVNQFQVFVTVVAYCRPSKSYEL